MMCMMLQNEKNIQDHKDYKKQHKPKNIKLKGITFPNRIE